MSNEEFRENLVASVKALGKTVVENAEDLSAMMILLVILIFYLSFL